MRKNTGVGRTSLAVLLATGQFKNGVCVEGGGAYMDAAHIPVTTLRHTHVHHSRPAHFCVMDAPFPLPVVLD